MGREERQNPASVIVQRIKASRDAFVQRLAEANVHTLDALGLILVATMPDPRRGPDVTYSTTWHNVWGRQLGEAGALQPALMREHLAAAQRCLDVMKAKVEAQILDLEAKIAANGNGKQGEPEASEPRPTEAELDAVEQSARPEEEADAESHE